MSSAGFPSLELERQGRPGLVVTLSALAVAIVIPWFVPMAWLFQSAAAIIACAVIFAGCQRVGLIGRHGIAGATWDSEGNWWLTLHDGNRVAGELSGGSRLMPGLVWLSWRSERGPFGLLLWRADIDSTTNRRLAVRLRLYRAALSFQPDSRVGGRLGYSSITDPGP